MKKPGRLKSFVLLLILGVLASVVWLRAGPHAATLIGQQRNLARARNHAATLERQLASDPRFARVVFGDYTGGPGSGGCLAITGSVADADVAKALRDMVIASSPPVDLAWALDIEQPPRRWRPTNTTATAGQWSIEVVPRQTGRAAETEPDPSPR
jgi:hypothetical protein